MSLKNLFLPKPRKTENGPTSNLENALEDYVASAPSVRNALDIFRGEWATKLPGTLGREHETGLVPAAEDPRLNWFIKEIKGVAGMNVLELGPLEAGHTYMLEQAGAARVLAIEANRRAFLKCLIIKEVLKLERATFLCGDFVEYLRTAGERFDLCVASGVLYHMRDPVELIALLSKVSDRLYFWTHYYDEDLISHRPHLIQKFPAHETTQSYGFDYIRYRFEYQASLDDRGFCGGSAASSNWMTREAILASLKHFGYDQIQTGWEEPNHVNGPAFAIAAVRS